MAEQGSDTKTSPKKEKSSVPAVEKALDVLELLAGAPDGLTMNEIVDALGRTMGEIYRVVVYLSDRDYLQQDIGTGRYALTLRLFELSHRHDPTERLIHASTPILERIAARTSQSCHLGVLNRSNILVISSVHSPLPAGYAVRTGALFPVDQTSSGHVILAFSDEEVQKRYVARMPSNDRPEIRERLKRIRELGFEDTPSTMILGVRNLCVPVFDARGVVGAITSGFIGQMGDAASAEETLATLRASSIELSQSLGFRLSESSFESTLTE
ncbi:IclR family transcriptional regulator [Cognatishimia sp. WU-CL00825]|uniref:IclR family transcriptional regulator n=1 Tax=Cognatishimia sp. WU-CL00825 TaxID=3127658 RepID=UPI0031090121